MEFGDFNLEYHIKCSSAALEKENSESSSADARLQRTLQLWDIARQIANGLQFLHGQKEVHRDLKPRNGRSMKRKIVDFSCLFEVGTAVETGGLRLDLVRDIDEIAANLLRTRDSQLSSS